MLLARPFPIGGAGNEVDVLRHLHLTMARQRVCIHLCPRTKIAWDTMHGTARDYLCITRMSAEGMKEEKTSVEEEMLPDEAISSGDLDPYQEDSTTADSEGADRRNLRLHGSPSTEKYWIHERDLTN